MAVSKRLRFEILRRDGHACRYCGTKGTADNPLTVDHVIPRALGGTDAASNLVTACADCNAGKSSAAPDAHLVADVETSAASWQAAKDAAAQQMVDDVTLRQQNREQFDEWWSEYDQPRPATWRGTVDALTRAGLPMPVLRECIDIACGARNARDPFLYMCGIAWRKVAELQAAATGITGEAEDDDELTFDDGRESFALDILDDSFDETERAAAIAYANDNTEEHQNRVEVAARYAVDTAVFNVWRFHQAMHVLFAIVPASIVETCRAEAEAEVQKYMGDDHAEIDLAVRMIYAFAAEHARVFLESLEPDEGASWLEAARATAAQVPVSESHLHYLAARLVQQHDTPADAVAAHEAAARETQES